MKTLSFQCPFVPYHFIIKEQIVFQDWSSIWTSNVDEAPLLKFISDSDTNEMLGVNGK